MPSVWRNKLLTNDLQWGLQQENVWFSLPISYKTLYVATATHGTVSTVTSPLGLNLEKGNPIFIAANTTGVSRSYYIAVCV